MNKFQQFLGAIVVASVMLFALLAGLVLFRSGIVDVLGGAVHQVLLAITAILLLPALVLPLFNPYGHLILKNLWRNLLRTVLTSLATMFLVFIITLVWTIVWFLDRVTEEKGKDFKAIVTERWQIPSQMPFAYEATLKRGAARDKGDIEPSDHMTWQFYGGTIDPTKRTRESIVFFFAMDPAKIRPMMDDAENFDPEMIDRLIARRNGAIIGRERLKALNRKVGDRITVTSVNYKDINLEFEIIGECPSGRYDQSAFMHRDYLNAALEQYKIQKGQPHPLEQKTLNLVWLRVPDRDAFQKIAGQILTSPLYTAPAVKCETASNGIATFLESYKDLLNFMKYVLVPIALGTMTLVVANAIGISVRERRSEMAVLKVLGFSPAQILVLVLGEALLVGTVTGLATSGLTYVLVNLLLGGIKFPIAFFPAFYIPLNALAWGLGIGAGTALAGSVWPAWTAGSVKPSEVFAKVA